MKPQVFDPLVTYRVQLHKGFGFKALKKIIPYLSGMGIKTIYASPIFSAGPGSEHGYDGIDPLSINPEVGTLQELYDISGLLKKKGMGWIQDFVPNHMAYHTGNKWLMDVLEKGQHSSYSNYFDIQWDNPETQGKIMVPFLSDHLENTIQNGELHLKLADHKFFLDYLGNAWPLNLFSYPLILNANSSPPALKDWIDSLKDFELTLFSDNKYEEKLAALKSLMSDQDIKNFITQSIEVGNTDKKKIQSISDRQYYLPCHWQLTDTRISYRRFFTVNSLICMNMQDENVFTAYHALLKKLCDDDVIDGVRVDHIDGLFDPGKYLDSLATHIGKHKYLVVEKILEAEEELENWSIAGTTGYEFLATVNKLFTSQSNEKEFNDFYKSFTGLSSVVGKQVYEKKTLILEKHMQGELDNLVRLFSAFGLTGTKSYDQTRIKNALSALLIHCPVYRFYFKTFPLKDKEQEILKQTFKDVLKHDPGLKKEVALLSHVFIDLPEKGDDELNKAISHFFTRAMQFSGPLMAKGVEDTLMYTYNRFIVHNEVGDAPSAFGIPVSGFHDQMKKRHQQWPAAMNATATHDTKRGEDARARLNVISDIPEKWFSKVKEWHLMNEHIKQQLWPDNNVEYFIYQSVLAHFPLVESDIDSFPGRLTAYLEKAGREGKMHSDWADPNVEYEAAITGFTNAILNKETEYYKSFRSFLHEIIDHGLLNSISQLILKFTCPGIPDIYQGCENWDFSFVDPDNRRPVAYDLLEASLNKMKAINGEGGLKELWDNRKNGNIKAWFVKQLAETRKQDPDLFSRGIYLPVEVEGRLKDHVMAFVREYKRDWILVVVPLHTASMEYKLSFSDIDWSDTYITMPVFASSAFSVLSNEKIRVDDEIPLNKLFNQLPFAILKGKSHSGNRKSGLLLHISSLPSEFGIGDLGPEAYRFADFLYRSNQRIWQMLPINPVEEGQGFSPYSSISSRAGNTLFISPERLVQEGLVPGELLQSLKSASLPVVDYSRVVSDKKKLLDEAWKNYRQQLNGTSQNEYEFFCNEQREWLPDFALYSVLRNHHGNKPWYEWPDEFKYRNQEPLNDFATNYQQEIIRVKWEQFIFDKQWHALKVYCNNLDIELFGDLPFYVSHDSADVWANLDIFNLDEKGRPISVAGVPPDFFSADGQLWGMPVFRWNILRANGFSWWAERLNRNIQLFDLVRLDHFRAFSAYWEVPASEKTAINGKWKKINGDYFFIEMEKRLGRLPFVAEDLGDIDAPVYKLRDKFNFPGMKVLQFAFGETMPTSIFIPHNYETNFIAYTGTHDNNTLIGWFNEADEETKLQVSHYVGQTVNAENIFNVLGRSLYASVADSVIFPLQDVLKLDANARMNSPSIAQGNWNWCLSPGQLTKKEEALLREWTLLYNR
jgi:malto-oligosyltrehalose synthase/4-alpha-glucanotransferase